MALDSGDARSGSGSGGRGLRLVQRVDMPVKPGGVIRDLHFDLAGVYFRLAPEGFLDRGPTRSALTDGATTMLLVIPTTPRTCRTIRSTSCRW